MKEQLTELRVEELRSFRGHPFQVKDDEAMDALCESIALYGVLSPLLARPVGEGYEIISGHRRRAAALRLGLDKLPVLVRDMTDDEAVILMVDSNMRQPYQIPEPFLLHQAAQDHTVDLTADQLLAGNLRQSQLR